MTLVWEPALRVGGVTVQALVRIERHVAAGGGRISAWAEKRVEAIVIDDGSARRAFAPNGTPLGAGPLPSAPHGEAPHGRSRRG